MRTSPSKLHGKHAWTLQGVQMIEGDISAEDATNETYTLHCNDGEFRTFPRAAVAFDVEAAQAQVAAAFGALTRISSQLDRQGAPLARPTLKAERWGDSRIEY